MAVLEVPTLVSVPSQAEFPQISRVSFIHVIEESIIYSGSTMPEELQQRLRAYAETAQYALRGAFAVEQYLCPLAACEWQDLAPEDSNPQWLMRFWQKFDTLVLKYATRDHVIYSDVVEVVG